MLRANGGGVAQRYRVSLPEEFNGYPASRLTEFALDMAIYFEQVKLRSDSERALAIGSCLDGDARAAFRGLCREQGGATAVTEEMVWHCLDQRFADVTEERRSLRTLMAAKQGEQSVSRWYNRLLELLSRPSMAAVRADKRLVTNLFVMGLADTIQRKLLTRTFLEPQEALEAAARMEQLGRDRAAGRQPAGGYRGGGKKQTAGLRAAQELDSSSDDGSASESEETGTDEADALAAMQQRGRNGPRAQGAAQPKGQSAKPPKKGKAVPGKDARPSPTRTAGSAGSGGTSVPSAQRRRRRRETPEPGSQPRGCVCRVRACGLPCAGCGG